MVGRSVYFLGAIGACLCAAAGNYFMPADNRPWIGFWICAAAALLGWWIGNSEKERGMAQIMQWLKARFQKSDRAGEAAVIYDGSRASIAELIEFCGDDLTALQWQGDTPRFLLRDEESYLLPIGAALVRGPTGYFLREGKDNVG